MHGSEGRAGKVREVAEECAQAAAVTLVEGYMAQHDDFTHGGNFAGSPAAVQPRLNAAM